MDVERIEIELEIARDGDLAIKRPGGNAFERRFEEAPLGDEKDQPGEEGERDQAKRDLERDPQGIAAAISGLIRGIVRVGDRAIEHGDKNRRSPRAFRWLHLQAFAAMRPVP